MRPAEHQGKQLMRGWTRTSDHGIQEASPDRRAPFRGGRWPAFQTAALPTEHYPHPKGLAGSDPRRSWRLPQHAALSDESHTVAVGAAVLSRQSAQKMVVWAGFEPARLSDQIYSPTPSTTRPPHQEPGSHRRRPQLIDRASVGATASPRGGASHALRHPPRQVGSSDRASPMV